MTPGPVPRGVRRCTRIVNLARCNEPFTAGPTEQVVALCLPCAAALCPRGTYDEMVAEYERLLSIYGWKAS